MKTLLRSIILFAFAVCARADVIVQDAQNVIITGQNVGTVADAVANHPAKIAEIQWALETYIAGLAAAKKAAADTLKETQDFAASLVSRAKAAMLAGNSTTLSAIIAEAETPAQQRKRAALEAKKAALEAEIAALSQ